MPLIKRSSKAARAVNVRRLIDEGYPPRQAVAIAYATQRAAKAHNRAGKPPKAPRPPAGTPTSGDMYVLQKELELHEKRNGQPQPLNAFEATSMGAIRKMLKAGYLAPAIGYPRGYWVTTGLADSALHEWRIRHAGVYGIPANYGQNAAGGKRRNRTGGDLYDAIEAALSKRRTLSYSGQSVPTWKTQARRAYGDIFVSERHGGSVGSVNVWMTPTGQKWTANSAAIRNQLREAGLGALEASARR